MGENNQNSRLAGPGNPMRSSQIVTTIIPASSSIPVFQPGNEFYLVLATAQVFIKPNGKSENGYTQGTGLRYAEENLFNQLQIRNPNAFSVVVSLFVGFGGYIDNRTILFDPLISQVVYPTAPLANTLNLISIPDKTGQAIVDINGNNFLALARTGIYVSNIDLATAYNLEAATVLVPPLVALVVQPLTNIVFSVSGDLRIKLPAGNINAVVSEVYSAVKPGLT